MSVLSMRSIIILLVLLVNTIYCDNEKDGKGVSVSQPDNSGSAVIDGVTVPIEVASTVKDDTGNETTTVEPTTTEIPTTTPTIKPTTSTTTTTTPKPNVTTTIKPTPVPTVTTIKPTTTSEMPVTTPYPPKNRHFDGASFIGGIILAVGLMGIGVIAFKYYKARTERNYHTL